ncbi:MAG: NAD(P)/FAD-dependent oxidoreductase [Verrucomicrobiota bacterium]
MNRWSSVAPAISKQYDVAVIGSGFGGSIMSMILKRLGRSVLLLEKGRHPRFAIGESSTPFSNLLLERIATDFDLPFLRPLCEWGSWKRTYPSLPVGLKRGFTFYHHERGKKLGYHDRSRQLLVAASPNDMAADTHWYRPEFDSFLVKKAMEIGVHYLENFKMVEMENSTPWMIRGENPEHEFFANFVIDASGSNSALARMMEIPILPGKLDTTAIYAHFRGVESIHAIGTPYPPDAAAVHHLFDGGWIWVLHFDNGITSAGAMLTKELSIELELRAGEESAAFGRLLQRFPSIETLFKDAQAMSPWFSIARVPFRRARMVGENWALLPSAAGFVDPLLSTGFALNLLGIKRLAENFKKGNQPTQEELGEYARTSMQELDATEDLITALYSQLGRPGQFNLLTLLYFASLSFTEAAWRLGKEELATRFLLENHSAFRRDRERLCALARKGIRLTRQEITRAIAPVDVIGLTDWGRDWWYPADTCDLIRSAPKLGATQEQVERLILSQQRLPIREP